MSDAKRRKGSGAPKAPEPQYGSSVMGHDASHSAELEQGEHLFVQLARKHWLMKNKATKVKVKSDVLKHLWDVLERQVFQHKTLLLLESLQTLESYLWPGYTQDSSNFHVMLVALIVNVKRRENLETWTIFEERPDDFSALFRRILSLLLDRTLSAVMRTQLVCFLIYAFQSLDCVIVRKECAPLVSIGIWQNLSSEKHRELLLDQTPLLRKSWRASLKRFDVADEATKARLRFERSWLYTLLLDFMSMFYHTDANADETLYCERMMEFVSDLQSQLPTRRYLNTLIQDLNLVPVIGLSPVYHDPPNSLLRDLHALLAHYTFFAIDDQTGMQLSRAEAYEKHCASLAKLQRVALKHFKDKLTVLALSNYGAISKRGELEALLEPLTDDETIRLASLLGIRVSYPDGIRLPVDRRFIVEFLVSTYEHRQTFQDKAQNMALAPTEKMLFNREFQRADEYDGSRPLALPKLNLQYLSAGDFLWRALVLSRCELFYGIRKDVGTALRRVRLVSGPSDEASFSGFSKMTLPISKPVIVEVVPPKVGHDCPSLVKAQVSIDIHRLSGNARREWDALRPDDAVFLLAVAAKSNTKDQDSQIEHDHLEVVSIRTADIIQMTDDKGRHLRDGTGYANSKRLIHLSLDSRAYAMDMAQTESGKPDAYSQMNMLLRRNRRENNFRPVLESIRSLVLSGAPLPPWLHEVFLGYGDPAGANYKNLPNRIGKLDLRDTFLDWQHLVESFPGKTVEPGDDVSGSFGPPYVLEEASNPEASPTIKPSKKRRRDAEPALKAQVETLKVFTYKPLNNGPYPTDEPRKNTVRFTPSQVEAIMSGSQPGLTIVVGPPGTGKTDVATQIISNIYHDFPEQKTLLIAHSNQALNQLFAKIVALDIDERHLLRLGHGEEELNTEGDFSKHGRIESFFQNRQLLLLEVKKLAACLAAPGAHDNSAETAGYFNEVYVQPAWSRFLQAEALESSTATDLVKQFPFHGYFADAPQPLFPQEAHRTEVSEIAHGCYRHISKIFSQLVDILPFEILRRERDKANYLLTKEARIIAMTTTHAAMRRGEIASLGFHYDNVIIEEAAQITEAETFLPLTMQKPIHGSMVLQRVVLCGDHLQNSPVIQSLAFRHYANLEQSLFSRLVRLGVPTITLDRQGRARPSIAKLYHWRYPQLGDLTGVQKEAKYLQANAGFKFDYQFINVPAYRGRGEAEPTPHFIQNLGEAEYAVAIYQYMRLLGYPADKISILTTYAGQRALVRDVLSHRCSQNPIFGMPKAVSTVDKYQGEQNDYIILSLTRTSRVGYLRDVRRVTVAVSRARLGLYILGRREVFEACPELRPAFELLLGRPDKLMLVTGELWPTERLCTQDEGPIDGQVAMEGVEHIGQYVFEMTKTKMEQVESGQALAAPVREEGQSVIHEDDDGDDDDERTLQADISEADDASRA